MAIDGILNVKFLDSLIAKNGESDYLCGMKVFILSSEDVDDANKYYNSLDIKQNTYLIWGLGCILHAQSNFHSAKTVYESAILNDERKENFWVHLNLAYLKNDMGYGYEEIESSILKAKKISNNALVTACWADININFGEYDTADSLLQTIPKNFRPSWINFLKGQIKFKEGAYNEAEIFYKKSIDEAKEDKDLFLPQLALLDTYIFMDQNINGEELLNEMLRKHPDDVSVLYRLCEIEDKKGNHQKSLETFEQIFQSEVLPNFLNEYVQISLDINAPSKTLEKFQFYKKQVRTDDYLKFGFYIDSAELLIYQKIGDKEKFSKLEKEYLNKYFEEEVSYMRDLLTK